MTDPNNFTVLELKEALRRRKLPMTGAKAELIARLMEDDPEGTWTGERGEGFHNDDGGEHGGGDESGSMTMMREREIEIYKREKELAERELELARREIVILRREAVAGRGGGSEPAARGDGMTTERTTLPRVQAWRPDLADLLSEFDGISSSFDTWEKQLKFLKATYHLDDDQTKILMGSKLKKRAFEWFHSRPEYIAMPFEELIKEFKAMFQRRESKAVLRKKFENRTWRRDETFHEYVHEKMILGNRVPVEQEEMLEHIIDGIPDIALRDQAHIQGFAAMDSLLRAFEKVSLRDRGGAAPGRRDEEREA